MSVTFYWSYCVLFIFFLFSLYLFICLCPMSRTTWILFFLFFLIFQTVLLWEFPQFFENGWIFFLFCFYINALGKNFSTVKCYNSWSLEELIEGMNGECLGSSLIWKPGEFNCRILCFRFRSSSILEAIFGMKCHCSDSWLRSHPSSHMVESQDSPLR